MYKSANQSGRSMIEMLGVLSIIGVLSVGGIAGFSKAMNSHKTNKCMEQIATIIANTRSIGLRQHGSFKGLTTTSAVKLRVAPEEMVKVVNKTTSLENVFGGEVKIGTSKAQHSNAKNTKEKDFSVEFYGLPRETCLEIMAKDWGGKRIGVLAAKDANTLSKASYFSSYEYSDTAECKTGTGLAFCVNKQMPLATANSACGCGKQSTCAVAVWLF